jgi:lysophospholipase
MPSGFCCQFYQEQQSAKAPLCAQIEMDDESKVLVIYTGGTIGMLVGHQGLLPEPLFLTETLRSQNRFHDPLQESPYSNSGSVQGFRQWSSSGTSTPLSNPVDKAGHLSDLLVRSSRPIGQSTLLAESHPTAIQQPLCKRLSEDLYEANLPSLVTPRSAVPGGSGSKRIRYAILEVRFRLCGVSAL